MAFLLSLKKIWLNIKPDLIKAINYVRFNDVSKLLLLAVLVGKCQLNYIIFTYIDPWGSIFDILGAAFFLTLNIFFVLYFISFLYYCSFNIKKTQYTLPKTFYILYINLLILTIYMDMNISLTDNYMAVFIYKFFYALVLLLIILNLRIVLIQQYNNVQNSIFKKVRNLTGLVVLASTPHHFYSRKIVSRNHYMLGFNTNIKTWFSLGIFIIMEQDGLYFKKRFINYNEIDLFNQSFNKKFTSYSKNELETALMYAI